MIRRTFLQATATSAVLAMFRNQLSFAKTGATVIKEPLLAPFAGGHGGVPPFDKIKVADFKPALLKGMELARKEHAAIADAKDPPTFDNTIAAYEDSGRAYGRAANIFSTFTATMNDKKMQAVEKEMTPLMAAFSDEVVQNEKLFARIKTVYDGRKTANLAPDQARLLETQYRYFARRGAALGPTQKARLKEINGKLASLYTQFGQNQLADEEGQTLVLGTEADLAGLPDGLRTAMKAAADGKGQKGKWLVTNTRSSVDPFLTYSTRRDLREKAFQMFISRGDHAGEHDNKPVIVEILKLRAERAKLLGFPTHAHWILDDTMAKTPDAAMSLMMKVWKAAVARVREEVADMQKLADAEKAGIKISPWDYRFYAEKVRKARYDLDANEVKQYLQLEKMREAMFWAANQLYGLVFTQIKGVPVYHPDVRVFEVTRDKQRVGLWYFDPYARDGKRSGAWMSEYRTQESFKGDITPIVSNNSNFVKGKPGEPVLISWDDATTLFHEFGHALHGLVSKIRYPSLAGTNTLRDFVEFPSQLNEHWLSTPEVLNKFAVHYKTGKPIPAELVAKIQKAKHFNEGFRTVEYLASAIYDMKIHTAPADKPIDPVAFEQKTLKEIGAPTEVVLRHRPPQFGHIFSGDEYSAGYYSYIWADTLTADAAEAFEQAGSFYDKPTAKKLLDSIMSVGNSVPPDVAFKNFRGRDVDTNALMRDRGFPVTK
ncbi:MAG TPA: M3 family metallopeptidase [Kofleriaceae bacterium]|nr:M3 family metallopeptidase [Kofleriaceae bacterium]